MGARELILPYLHLDVTFARNRRAVGDVHLFQLVHASTAMPRPVHTLHPENHIVFGKLQRSPRRPVDRATDF